MTKVAVYTRAGGCVRCGSRLDDEDMVTVDGVRWCIQHWSEQAPQEGSTWDLLYERKGERVEFLPTVSDGERRKLAERIAHSATHRLSGPMIFGPLPHFPLLVDCITEWLEEVDPVTTARWMEDVSW